MRGDVPRFRTPACLYSCGSFANRVRRPFMMPSSYELVELDLTFRALDVGDDMSGALPAVFGAAWPSYQSWFLRDGEQARASYETGAQQLRRHMPELVGTYDRLVSAVGGGDLEARFLSHWAPPPVATACSLAVWNRAGNVLVRNYDHPPLLCDTTVLASCWNGTRVVAMSDCLWGAVDGMNDHGVAAAIAFGGRAVVGEGFGIGLVIRYLLEFARDVPEAIDVLRQVPVSMAYNVALLDRAGTGVIVEVSPDRPMSLMPGLTAGNRQGFSADSPYGRTEWPEHAAMCGTVEREQALAATLDEPWASVGGVVSAFLRAPVHRDPAASPWGTVYTAAYDCDAGTLDLLWPDDAWRLSLHGPVEGMLTRRSVVAVPARPAVPVPRLPAVAPEPWVGEPVPPSPLPSYGSYDAFH